MKWWSQLSLGTPKVFFCFGIHTDAQINTLTSLINVLFHVSKTKTNKKTSADRRFLSRQI